MTSARPWTRKECSRSRSAPRRSLPACSASRDYRGTDLAKRTGEIMSVAVSRQQNFVGGEWVDAIEGGTAEIINPATGETIAEVPSGTEADVDRAVEAAKAALPEWLETTPGERADMLLKLADAIE